MIRLTNELVLLSSLLASAAVDSQELTFNLARRSGVVINQIYSEVNSLVGSGDTLDDAAQEVDLDPDNVDVFGGATFLGDQLVMDTSRLMRHSHIYISRNGVAEAATPPVSRVIMEFRNLRLEERPISITNLRHHLRHTRTIGSGAVEGHIIMRYIIVELTLLELGILNASRR